MRNIRNITVLLATALTALLAKTADTQTPEAKQAKRALNAHRKLEAEQTRLAKRILGGSTAQPQPASVLRSVLVACEQFIRGFEDDELQEGIPQLLEQLRTAIAQIDYQPCAVSRLRDMIEAADEVVANWERGDLASAVNNLEGWADTARSELEGLSQHFQEPAVVVEITGGNCSDISVRGHVRVIVLDYDNGASAADDDASCPEIPGSNGSRASIGDIRGPQSSRFVDRICALADADAEDDFDEDASQAA